MKKLYDDNKTIAFINDRSDTVTVNPPVRKVVEGTDKKDTFTFIFEPVSNTAGIEVADMPLPDGASDGKKQITYDGAGEHEFGEFELSIPGTYVYQITEEKGSVTGYTYDETVYTVTYEVTANGIALEAVTTITKDDDAVDEAVFTNKYEEPKKEEQQPSNGSETKVDNNDDSDDGDDTTKVKRRAVSTGDDTYLMIYLLLMSGAAIALGVLGAAYSRREGSYKRL